MGDLVGKKILITSGPTRGPLDAIRYITNKSTGRLGVVMATQALSRGASVTFVYGKGSLTPDPGVVGAESFSRLRLLQVETVDELMEAIKEQLRRERYDAVLHSMAVLDYVPETYADEKTRSGKEEWWIRLVRTPKVVKVIKDLQPETILVGFKLEVDKTRHELIDAAHRSLTNNEADLVLANDLREIEQGRHVGYMVNQAGDVEDMAEGKQEIARMLLNAVADRTRSHSG